MIGRKHALLFYCLVPLVCADIACAAELRRTVAPGETLDGICARLSGKPECVAGLQRRNSLAAATEPATGTLLSLPAGLLAEAPIVGGVLESSGEAAYRPLEENDFTPLAAGEPIYLGDSIRTGEGTAMLEFVSGLLILLRPHSLLVLDMFSDAPTGALVEVALERGSMEASTPTPRLAEAAAPQGGGLPAMTDVQQLRTGDVTARIAGEVRLHAADTPGGVAAEALQGEAELRLGEQVFNVPPGHGWSGVGGQRTTLLLPAPAASPVDPGDVAIASFQRMFAHTPQDAARSPPRGQVDALAALLRGALQRQNAPAPFDAPSMQAFGPVALEWKPDPGSVAWQLELLIAPPGTPGPRSLRLQHPRAALAQLGDGCYMFGLRAIDARGIAGHERLLPLCVHPRLAAPSPRLAPETSHRVVWEPVKGAEQYQVELSGDPGFNRPLREELTPLAEFALDSLQHIAFLRVRAVNAAGLAGPVSPVVTVGAP
jgi:hypothetical protein